MNSVSTTDINHSGIDTTRLPGSTREQYRRNASGMVTASGPCTKKPQFAASGVLNDRDTIRARSCVPAGHAKARSRWTAALIRERWEKACGKLPSASPEAPISSA